MTAAYRRRMTINLAASLFESHSSLCAAYSLTLVTAFGLCQSAVLLA